MEHERHSPREHGFAYPVYTYLFDVDELERLDDDLRLFGHNRVRLAAFHDADYLERGKKGVREKLARLLAPHGLQIESQDQVLLATSARFLNYVFNPVSFYWVYREDALRGVVAEVNNTFGEKHVYPLVGPGELQNGHVVYQAEKAFHVSPFYDRQGVYTFTIGDVRDKLDVGIRLEREGETTFEARLVENHDRRELTDGILLRTALTRPFTAHLTYPRILWEAAKIHFGKKIDYHPKPAPQSTMTIREASRQSMVTQTVKRLVLKKLASMKNGSLMLTNEEGKEHFFGEGQQETEAQIHLRSDEFFPRVAFNGDIGLGESYTEGLWDSPDLVKVFSFLLQNRPPVNKRGFFSPALARLWGQVQRVRHQLAPANTEAGSRRNISKHYDLSNELFEQFLDPTMTYSSGVFLDPRDTDESLEESQLRKNRLLADKADIQASDHILEIGCGWGGFAEQTAKERGCRVTGVTVSKQQFEYARQRIQKAGLENLVDIRLQDYRKIGEQFDKIVSIEMLEAVGHEFHVQFFKSVDRLLRPGGVAVIQTITIQDGHYDQYRSGLDWIRKHIFPGGVLPSLSRICGVTAKHTTLHVHNVDAIGLHYANTLVQWRRHFLENWDAIETLGFDAYFKRTWEYYFSICEAGFLSGHINDLQIVLASAEPKATSIACLRHADK